MTYINLKLSPGNGFIIMDCHKNSKDGEYFRLVVNPHTMEVIEAPNNIDIDVTTAYSHLYSLLKSGNPLPKETVSAWG